MIIDRGYDVRITLASGRVVRGSSLLHDETGRDLPANVVLVMPYRKTGKLVERPPGHVKQHFGNYPPRDGVFIVPPDDGWVEVGQVAKLEYTRRGELHHGQKSHRKTHPFSKMPTLYRRGTALKIGPVAWDWRGVRG